MEDLVRKESLGKGIVFQYGYYAALTLSGAAFYLYLTHVYPTSTVGSVALLLAIVGLIPAFFTLGLQYGWQHFVSYSIGRRDGDEISRLIRQATRIGALLSLAGALFLLLTARYISIFFFHTASYATLVLLMALDIPSAIMITILNAIMLGLQRFRTAGIIGMTYVVLVYGSAVFLLNALHSIEAVPLGWGVGYFVGVLLYYSSLTRGGHRSDVQKREMGDIFRYSFPLYLTGILSFGATYIDRFIVALLKDLSSIGIYTLVLLIASGVGLLSAPIGGIIFSKFSEFFAKKDNEMIKEGVRISVNAASILYVPAAIGLSAISVPILRILGGPAYVIGSLPMVIILIVNAVFIGRSSFGSALQGTRKTLVFVLSAGLALLSNLMISLLLIPGLSLVGAAIGFASVPVVNFVILLFFGLEADLVKVDLRMVSRIWISSIVMGVFVYLFAYSTGFYGVLIPLYVLTGLVAYIGMLKLTSAVSEADKLMLVNLIPGSLSPLRTLVDML